MSGTKYEHGYESLPSITSGDSSRLGLMYTVTQERKPTATAFAQ